MATLYITEFAGRSERTGAPLTPPLASQAIAITGSSIVAAAFNPKTTLIRVSADAVCSVYIGSSTPVATTGLMRIPANVSPELFNVTAGEKLAVISNT